MREGLEAILIKAQHCVFLYRFDAPGCICDRVYRGGSAVSGVPPPFFASGIQLVVRGSNMIRLTLKANTVFFKNVH